MASFAGVAASPEAASSMSAFFSVPAVSSAFSASVLAASAPTAPPVVSGAAIGGLSGDVMVCAAGSLLFVFSAGVLFCRIFYFLTRFRLSNGLRHLSLRFCFLYCRRLSPRYVVHNRRYFFVDRCFLFFLWFNCRSTTDSRWLLLMAALL